MGFANGLVALSNIFYFRVRPFNALPDGTVNLLFYKPTDSSFPSNFATVLFAIAFSFMIKDRRWGSVYLALALIGGFARVFVGIHYPLDILGGHSFWCCRLRNRGSHRLPDQSLYGMGPGYYPAFAPGLNQRS